MKKKKILFSLLFMILLISCEKETEKEVVVSDLALNQKNLELRVENTDSLKVTVTPADANDKSIIWKSSDNSVATVDSGGVITAIAPGKALITATTTDGNITDTCIVNSVKWTVYHPYINSIDNSIHSIAVDEQDNIWCGGYSLLKFDGTNWTTYMSNQGVGYISIDHSGNKWFGTYGYGIAKFDGTNWTTYTSDNSGLKDNSVTAMAVDKSGNLWVGTSSRTTLQGTGVSEFDGTQWSSYTTNDGLVYRNVTSIAPDNEGNVWFVAGETSNGGISKFDGSGWTSYTESNTNIDLLNFPYCMAIDAQNNKWFVTKKGDVLKFDGTNQTTIPQSVSGMGPVKMIAFDSKGNAWFCIDSGVIKFDGTSWTKYNDNGLLFDVSSIAFDSNGDKWIGAHNGIYELQD